MPPVRTNESVQGEVVYSKNQHKKDAVLLWEGIRNGSPEHLAGVFHEADYREARAVL